MRLLKRVGLVLAIFLVSFVTKLLWDAGAFLTVHPHVVGICERLGPIPGPEDIEIARGANLAFFTSDDRYAPAGSKRGAIFLLRTDGDGKLVKIWEPSFEFHPHGLGLFEGDGKITLFVVNHRAKRDTIEVLEYSGGAIRHVRSVGSPTLLYNANDVAAIDDRRFYVTHDHGARSELGRSIEQYIRVGRGFVTYFDGEKFRTAASGISFANGIERDGNHVLVAAMTGKEVLIFLRNEVSGSLTLERRIALPSAPDNLSFDAQGTLWIGAHPKLLALKSRSHDPKALSPGQVLRVREPYGTPVIDEVFLSAGDLISAASVAVPFDGRLLIGSVFDDHALWCTLPR